MIIVGNALISEEILEQRFLCQLDKCHGACCVQGDAGAPLDLAEIDRLADVLPNIRPFLSSDGLWEIDQGGFSETDREGEPVTRCLPTGECVFVVYEGPVAVCGIEKAWLAGATDFRKPVSCHLYPIRAKKYGDYIALNYHHWDICSPACKAGIENQVPVHRFLRDALVRKMGPEWYDELEAVYLGWIKKK